MRRLLESLVPDSRPFYWKWVGGVFAAYVLLLATAAGVFVSHESPRRLARQPAATVTVDGNPQAIPEAPLKQATRY